MNMRRFFSRLVKHDHLGFGKKDTEKMECDLLPLLISYEKECKDDSEFHGYDSTLRSMIYNVFEFEGGATCTNGGGGGLQTQDFCGRSITALSYSNKVALDEISSLKSTLRSKTSKLSWYKTRKTEEEINLLADQYITNSDQLLDFVTEMESFQRKARDSCGFITREIEKCTQMKQMRRNHTHDKFTRDINTRGEGNTYYSRVLEILNNLTASNTFDEPSTSALLARLDSIKEKQIAMIESLKKQQRKLGKSQDLTRWLRRAKNAIFMGAMASMVVATIVATVLGAAPIAGAIPLFLPYPVSVERWLHSRLVKRRDSANFKVDLNESMLQGTRVANKELGNIKFLIQGVVNEINSLEFRPGSKINEGQIDSSMNHIENNLKTFMTKIKELEKETEKFSKEIRKARDEVYIGRRRLGYSGSVELPSRSRRI